MSVAVIVPNRDISILISELKEKVNMEIIIDPIPEDYESITIAILWNQPPGILGSFPNIELICSFGAGVDHIINDPGYDPSIPVTRVVDEDLTASMSRYVVAAVSMFQYGFHLDNDIELGSQYRQRPIYSPKLTVGILGLGALGEASAKCFRDLGYEVNGLSRNLKTLTGIHTFALSEMDEFLANTNILVCMLPLTPTTEDIIDLQLLNKLKKPSFLINVGRGNHVIEDELLIAVREGVLLGACLDVLRNEPIGDDHPFISENRIIITPHIASITNQYNAARLIAENISRFSKGEKLLHKVDSKAGY